MSIMWKCSRDMRVVCISDTHGFHRKLSMPKGDIFIFAGDVSTSWGSNLYEYVEFNEWLGTLDYDIKIMIAGNHDVCFEIKPEIARKIITNAVYLQNSGIEFEGLKIWGSPATPDFAGAFNYDESIQRVWDMIPDDTNILVTHGPPRGILDKNSWGEHCGCPYLLERTRYLYRNLKLNVFGHIHESYGKSTVKCIEEISTSTHLRRETTFVNASIWNHIDNTVREPIVVEI